jgi:hypothetical protein
MPLIAQAEVLDDLGWTAAVERWAREELANRPG